MYGDGNCFFCAVSYQLYNTPEYHLYIRFLGIQHLQHYPELCIESNYEQSWQYYVNSMARQGTWADNIIIQAVANSLNVTINIIESNANFSPVTVNPERLKLSEVDKAEKRKASKRKYIRKKHTQTVNPKRLKLSEVEKAEKHKASKRECIRKKHAQTVNPERVKLSEVDKAEKRKASKRECIQKKRAQTLNPKRLKLSEVDRAEKHKASKREHMRKKRQNMQKMNKQKNANSCSAVLPSCGENYANSCTSMVAKFHKNISCGPEYICTCCDQLWYRTSVRKCNTSNYTNCQKNLVQSCITGVKSIDNTEWICNTCHLNIREGK